MTKTNGLSTVGYGTSGVSFITSLGVLSLSPELILTYISILCMVVSLVSSLILTTIKIVQLVREKKYEKARDELKNSAEELGKKANEINDKINNMKGEK